MWNQENCTSFVEESPHLQVCDENDYTVSLPVYSGIVSKWLLVQWMYKTLCIWVYVFIALCYFFLFMCRIFTIDCHLFCLLAWIHRIHERCNISYLLPVFWVTPFSICGLPGCLYWLVVCLRVGSCNFHLCSLFLLLVSIIITSSRQLNSGSYNDVACSFSINLNSVISSSQSPYGNLPHHCHWDHAASVTSE